MRILEVNGYHYPYMGGIEHRVHHLSKRLAKKHEVIVLTSQLPGTAAEEEMDGYLVKRMPSRYLNIYNPPHVITKGVLQEIESIGPDVVDFHYRWAGSYNKPAQRYGKEKVFTFHNTFGEGAGITRAPSVLNDMLWKRHLRRFDKITCISEFIRKDLMGRGFEPQQLETIPNGIEIPNGFEWKENDFILFVGRLVGTKGIPYLLKAMRDIDTKLIVCGGGPDLNKLKRLAGRYGVDDKVEFPGRVSEERKNELFATCMLFVMPSVFESYGIAAAEAMSYRKAIVASDTGGLPEVIGDGGLLSRPRDPEDLAVRINDLLGNDALRHEMARRAEARSHTYTWDRSAKMTEKLYEGVCK